MNDAQSKAPPRQTRSFLLKRFEEAGIRPKTRFGQNFLIDLNLLDLLYESADVGPNDVVLEVGGGTGALTARLAAAAAHVVTVEIDRQLFQLAREELYRLTNVTMMEQDALRNKNNMHPAVLAEVTKHLAAAPGRRFKLVSNLPYNVATPVVSNLLKGDPVPYSMTVTIQKELALRMVASPKTRDYSALSLWVQSQCDVELVRIMPPSAFWPQPKVDSAIVRLTLRPDLRIEIPDLDFFHTFIRSMFFHRRKFLRSELLAAFKGKLDKPQVDEVMAELKHGGTSRAEELSVEEMLELCEAVRKRLKPE
jgi:16S rRNA (adenine1518-N6/adenine1519-N6)-dimethyltransferase